MKDNERLITEADSGGRLDHYLNRVLNAAPKGFIHKMLRLKRIKLNGAKALGGEILKDGDVITFYISPETMGGMTKRGGMHIKPNVNFKSITLYEDERLLILNKPAGIRTHGGGMDLEVRAAYFGDGIVAPAPVHRLDTNTSGVLAFAKTLSAARELAGLKGCRKFYLAAVSGAVDKPLTLKGYIEKDRAANKSAIGDSGKEITTVAVPVKIGGGFTVLIVEIQSGKSHQIRAHLQSAGFPIIGDPKYGDMTANRRFNAKNQLLHAYRIKFENVGGVLAYMNGKTIEAPPPNGFKTFMEGIDEI